MRGNENGKRGRKRRCKKGEDRISQLPDDILISIISRLTSREATATSVLSVRWRSLCAYATRIDFPRFAPKYTIRKRPRDIQASTIDRVLDSHRGGRVKEFRVDVSSSEEANVGKWLEFALAKEAEIIDIRLTGNHYPLRHTIFDHDGESSRCLKELSLRRIDVDDRELVLLVRSFPLLESLAMSGSSALRNVSIVGLPASKLKHLHIGCSQYVESIKIDGLVNLVSLECYGLMKTDSLTLNNVPKLIEFRTIDSCFYTMADALSRMSSSIRHQLQTLKLSWNFFIDSSAYDQLNPMQYIGIRNLELTFGLSEDVKCVGKPLNLIQACPSLEKLEIKVSRFWSRKLRARVSEDTKIFWHRRLPKLKLSPNLKKVKFSGFGGTSLELEFALSIMKNVEALEELVVEACDEYKKIRALAIDRARQHFPPKMLPYPFTLLIT